MIVEIDGASRHDIDCGHCIHFNPETEVCNIAHQSDEKTYPFCGQICGYFKFQEGGEIRDMCEDCIKDFLEEVDTETQISDMRWHGRKKIGGKG